MNCLGTLFWLTLLMNKLLNLLRSKKFKSLGGGLSKIKLVNFISPYSRKVIYRTLSVEYVLMFQSSSLAGLFLFFLPLQFVAWGSCAKKMGSGKGVLPSNRRLFESWFGSSVDCYVRVAMNSGGFQCLRGTMVICGLFEGYPVPFLAKVLRQGSPAPRSRAGVGVDSGRVQLHPCACTWSKYKILSQGEHQGSQWEKCGQRREHRKAPGW